jgi:hypothetical protein
MKMVKARFVDRRGGTAAVVGCVGREAHVDG